MKRNKNTDLNKTVRKIGLSLCCICLSVLIISAVATKKSSSSIKIDVNIDTHGAPKSMLVQSDIINIIERTFGFDLVGISIDEIDVLATENLLKNVPHIKDANVYIDALNTVHVDVQPRKAVLRIVDEFGSNYFLDEDGIRLPTSTNFTPRVLIANGYIPQYNDVNFQEKSGILYEIYKLGLAIAADDFLAAQIDQIYLNKVGQIELTPKIGEQNIIYGKVEHMEDKLQKLKAFYKNGIVYKGWKTYSNIDLRYNNQVVCKKTRS